MLSLSFLILPAFVHAQPVSITSSVNKGVVALDDQIVLSVTLSGGQMTLPEPQLPTLPNFTVYGSGSSQNVSILNGQVSSSMVYTYVLVPRFVGKSMIGPIQATVGGKTVSTSPIEVQVLRPNQVPGQPGSAGASPQSPPGTALDPARTAEPAPPPAAVGPDVFVTASVDKKQAYVNEQVTLTVRFHTAVSLLGNPQYTSPPTSGFLSEDLPPERHGQVQSRGRLYYFSEIKTALFPAQAGRLTIGPATIRCQVQAEVTVDPFAPDFFQRFFSQGLLSAQTRELKTDPLMVRVEPLPAEGKPESFTGAVGRYRVSAEADKRSLKVGEAMTFTITVEGTGNLKALGAPKLPDLGPLRVFDTVSSLNLNKAGDVVQGAKAFKTVLTPRASGTHRLPAIEFSYFDPRTGEYSRAGTSPMELQVEPAAPGSPGAQYVSPDAKPTELAPLAEDIRYIKEDPSVPLPTRALSAAAGAFLIHLAPLGVFLASLGLGTWRERRTLDPAGVRFRRALSKARSALREAGDVSGGLPQRSGELLAGALTGFLADKLGTAASGLTLRGVLDVLRERQPQIQAEQLESLKSLWEELDLLRFAGQSAEPETAARLTREAQVLLEALDRNLHRETPRGETPHGGRASWGAFLLFLSLSPNADALALQEGHQAFREGRYTRAAEVYEAALRESPDSGVLHYDLAGARLKEGSPGSLGRAIAGYWRAWRLAPRDADIRYNLEFVLRRAGESFVPPGSPRALHVLWFLLSDSELLGLQWLGYWACLLLSSLWILVPAHRDGLRPWLVGALAFWLVFGGWWASRRFTDVAHPGVVVTASAEARSGPGVHFPVSFAVPEGRRVTIASDDSDWLEIGVLKEGLKGWIPAQAVERL